MQPARSGVSTRAACQRADWDSRQLSPSSGGGSDIKCSFHSCDVEPPSPSSVRPNVSLGGELWTDQRRG